MRNVTKLILIAAVTAAGVWAQNQIATVTSLSPFTLRGTSVAVGQGVPDWPVLDGDTIEAGTTPATIVLPDQSVLSLAPDSDSPKEELSFRS